MAIMAPTNVSLNNAVSQKPVKEESKGQGAVNRAEQAQISSKTEDTKKKNDTQSVKQEEQGVVYEKSEESAKINPANKIYDKDAVIAKLKADQQSRLETMQSLVSKLLGKQVDLFAFANADADDETLAEMKLADKFRIASEKADPETIQAAKESISEDGYWGVNQTSDRMVSMAIALTGGDTTKADEMMEAIEKGFKKAAKAWGEELPQISKDTLEATRKKMEDWKNGVTTAADYSNYLS